MKGRWRLFRHDAGRAAGPPPWAYVALFAACLSVGLWSTETFGAVVIWPANGVLFAALLQLHRRPAIGVIVACLAINLASNVWRGDPQPFVWLNALLNLGQVMLAAVIARRVCGAALDIRRPRRFLAFGLLAVVPAVLLSAVIATSLAATIWGFSLPFYLFGLKSHFDMELLGLLIVTPALLFAARAHRFADPEPRSWLEKAGLMALLVGCAVIAFGQSHASVMFIVFPPLLLVVFRLSPPWAAGSVLIVAVVGAVATLTGNGPIPMTRLVEVPALEGIPPLMRQLAFYNLFLLALVVTALPISTIVSERQRLVARLNARTQTAQAARRRAEDADAAKSRFLALMSHEMRTPLHSVVGYAEVLGRRPDLMSDARHQAEMIQTAGNALLVLVEDVLEVSRGVDVLCLDTVQLSDLLHQAAAPSREVLALKGLELDIVVETEADTAVQTDPKRLRQAVHKLVCNAVKFTETGRIEIRALREGDWLRIVVTDTGCGINPEVLPTIFDAFVQGDDSIARDHRGAGLGLAVARRLIERLDGMIAVQSVVGEGSTFTLALPLPSVGQASVMSPIDAEPVASAPRVLVVDDHPANREVARLMLAVSGAEIVEACDGVEAVEMAKAQAFDLILMDVRMPRMDGLAATRAIRALPAPMNAVPILAVTADAMAEDAARCLAAGMNGHLAKPITHTSLYAAIDHVMAGPGAAEGAAAA